MSTDTATTADAAPERPGVTVLKRRIFKMGAMELVDLTPHLEPAEALKLYEASHPILKSCTLGDCYEEGGALVYPIEKPPVQTKGAR
jgi:hypothetical protein